MVEELTAELFKKIKEELPDTAKISDIRFEGAEIVLYTKSKEFFTGDSTDIKGLVGKFKKRILLRPDPALCLDMEDAKRQIDRIIPKEAVLREVLFEPAFGTVTLEAEKPGLVIGKGGETLREVKRATMWAPIVRRAPLTRSDVIQTLRDMLYRESEFRKVFLDKVGRRIHGGWKQTDWLTITALGGFREVGRSCVLLRTPESRVLLDCGVKPGTNEYPYLSLPEADIQKLDAVVLSHTHMDHAAMIPYLYEYGCEAPLYCTAPTRDLMVLMCLDFLKIAQREGKTAPYTTKGIKEAVKRCITLNWEEVTDITPDMRLTLLNNGHILGGSIVHIHVGEGLHNILYTGDIKFDRTALFDPASTNFSRAETIITESTYGLPSDLQPRRPEAEANLIGMVKRTIERKGKVLIPSFAVERSQDIQVILARSGLNCPIYLDGMVWDVSAMHTAYPEYLSRELQKDILHQGWNPFTLPMFKRIGSEEERLQVVNSKEPCVIISTSGMLTGGPALWWLKNLAEDKRNTLAFVGYQAENTLGRKILKGWKEIPMEENGRNIGIPINLEVAQIDGLSGHSDFKQLLNFIKKTKHAPERIIVNHGDPVKCVEFAKQAYRFFGVETLAPKLLETVRLK